MAQLLIDKVKDLEHKIDTMKNQRADDLNLIESLEYATQKSAERLLDLQSDYTSKVIEIADLKRQVREWETAYLNLTTQKLVLEQQLAEAQKDTERMDWLEENPESEEPILVYHPPDDLITWRLKSDEIGREYKTLREAIDAARGVSR